MHTAGRWYLAAWDVDRRDWRIYRVDRLEPRIPTGPRFAVSEPPEGDVAAFVGRSLGTATLRYRARVTVHAPAELIAKRLPPAVQVEAIDERTCSVAVGSDSPAMLALYVGMLDADFEVTDAPELSKRLRLLSERYRRATS